MKVLLVLFVLSVHSYAEVELRYSRFEYKWWDYASFPVSTIMVGYTGWHRDKGLTVLYGNSNTRKNTRKSPYSELSARIENLTIIGIRRRKRFAWGSIDAGLNYTSYREHVTGPGIDDSNLDFGTGYNFSVSKGVGEGFKVKLSWDTLYRKNKPGHGVETTNSASISIVCDLL